MSVTTSTQMEQVRSFLGAERVLASRQERRARTAFIVQRGEEEESGGTDQGPGVQSFIGSSLSGNVGTLENKRETMCHKYVQYSKFVHDVTENMHVMSGFCLCFLLNNQLVVIILL